MKATENGFWQPSPDVRRAIVRGNRKCADYFKRILAEAEAERLGKLLTGEEKKPQLTTVRKAA